MPALSCYPSLTFPRDPTYLIGLKILEEQVMKLAIPMLQTSKVKYLFPGADGTADCNSKSENSELTSIETSKYLLLNIIRLAILSGL
ncbi:MAG: hypothetical protein P8M05_09430 [Flavobacteriales bacterium]|nr:hypothetical protein [Flavobacteriales bacterium]